MGGMQFLTSAFYLPYLVTRTGESPRLLLDDGTREVFYDEAEPVYDFETTVVKEDITGASIQRRIAENTTFQKVLGGVGAYSILWFLFADGSGGKGLFGDNFGERWESFGELLSIDRVGCSFLVDLVIFGVFQGWLVDDDLRRRGTIPETAGTMRIVAKYVPFFGLVAYFLMRPSLPSKVTPPEPPTGTTTTTATEMAAAVTDSEPVVL